jgi:FMN reductase
VNVVLVGNPKPDSRTLHAATHVAEQLTGNAPDQVVDIATFGTALLQSGDAGVAAAVSIVQQADMLVVASPTYKASYTGLLKLFLDKIPGNGLAGVTAFPMMLGAATHHALAADVFLKPVLVELGACCPARGLFLLDSDYTSEVVLEPWLAQIRAPRTRVFT